MRCNLPIYRPQILFGGQSFFTPSQLTISLKPRRRLWSIKTSAQILSTQIDNAFQLVSISMHAALISLVLMSGACGDLPPPEGVTVSMPAPSPSCGCGCASGCGSQNLAVPPMYRNCPQFSRPELHTVPAWQTDYHPACYFYPNHRMLFDAADYAKPYPYRERFNYPWNDPRCRCATPNCGE